MKKLISRTLTAILAVALVSVPTDIYAQAGRGGSSPRSSSSSSRSSAPSRSSSGPSRSSSHSSAPARSSGYSSQSYSRSSATPSRQTPAARPSSPQSRQSSAARSSSPQSRQGSAARPASPQGRPGVSQSSSGAQARTRVAPSRPSGQTATRPAPTQGRQSTTARPASPQGRPGVSQSSSGTQARTRVAPSRPGTSSGVHPAGRPSQRPAPGQISRHSGRPAADVHFDHGRGGVHQHPHHRDFIPYDRPGRFFGAGPHYFGYRIHTLPPHYRRLHYWGHTYFFYNDIYYRPFGDYYVVCRPPFGVYYHPSLLDVALCAVDFAFYYDIYHNSRVVNSNWQTIEEQNQIIAQNNALIASQNQAMQANSAMSNASYELSNSLGLVQRYADASTKYYYEDGVFFVMDSTGQYKVIVPPAGALVDKLPEDYEEVVLNGTTYYKVDDTIYRMVMIEGAAKFEVLGQQV